MDAYISIGRRAVNTWVWRDGIRLHFGVDGDAKIAMIYELQVT